MRRPPIAVLVYASVVALVVVGSLVREGAHPRLLFGATVLVAATLGLCLASWPAWLFLVVVHASSVAHALASRYVWWVAAASGCMLALLLLPSTRRFARRSRPRFL